MMLSASVPQYGKKEEEEQPNDFTQFIMKNM